MSEVAEPQVMFRTPATAGEISRVDREGKVINGYVVAQAGSAKGHGLQLDKKTLEQIVFHGNAAQNGIKSRFKHPEAKDVGGIPIIKDTLGTHLGRSKNFRIDGDKVRADLHLSKASFRSPLGDLGNYTLDLAEDDPDSFGASIVFSKDKSDRAGNLVRIGFLSAIDVVGDPAAADGLFSAELATEEAIEMPEATPAVAPVVPAVVVPDEAALAAVREEVRLAENKRVSEIIALCGSAKMTDLVPAFIADVKFSADDCRKRLFDEMCKRNVGAGGEGAAAATAATTTAAPDENEPYRQEFAANPRYAKSFTEAEFIAMRRIDDGLEFLTTKQPA